VAAIVFGQPLAAPWINSQTFRKYLSLVRTLPSETYAGVQVGAIDLNRPFL
jgi:hypothetical protein